MGSLRGCRLDRQGVDGPADLVAEDVVHHAMLLDAGPAGERRRNDGRAEVVAPAREVLDLGPGVGNAGLDAALDVLRAGHVLRG